MLEFNLRSTPFDVDLIGDREKYNEKLRSYKIYGN